MASTKNIKRAFASELQSLPVQLVPPDPLFQPARPKQAARTAPTSLPEQPEIETDVLARLISKIKRI
jgi:hypothetical protein